MSDEGLQAAIAKMKQAGVGETAIHTFANYYRQLERGVTGVVREGDIAPLPDPPQLAEVNVDPAVARRALDQTVFIKLNGGLGTSMGLDKAKSLLVVRDEKRFLDIVVDQVFALRRRYGVRMPLLLMDSFRTRDDTLAALAAYPDLPVDGLPLDFLQSQEPKLRVDDLTPVRWDTDPQLEWTPPGHGDIYASLRDSGLLDALLLKGYRYAFAANFDNLGALPTPELAGWFAETGAAYGCEVCVRTANDKKGGHLAIRKSDGRIILRDTAQTAPEEMEFFTDEHHHPFFHVNNLWWNLEALHDILDERDGVLGLPMIRNVKTVDPTDPRSPEVIQIESAMGAAVEVFEDAQVICVPRDRFIPVKKTNELLLLRSDVYRFDEDSRLCQVAENIPLIDLGKHYRFVRDFDARIPQAPSLAQAEALIVHGDWWFGRDIRVVGRVELGTEGGHIPDGTMLGAR